MEGKMADSGSIHQTSEDTDAKPNKLSDLLNRGWKIFEEVDTTNEPIGSNHVQVKIRRGITALEEVTRMVAELQLFSRNELLEDLATADLRYLMPPALLGGLTLRLSDRDRRAGTVTAAREHFTAFLRRCKEYHVSDFKMPKAPLDADEESRCSLSTTKVTRPGVHYLQPR